MPTTLTAMTGRTTGSAASRRLRAENQIPGVIYGHGMDPIAIAVDRRDLRIATSGAAGLNTILDLDVDGTTYPAIIKELQRHPVRRTVTHVDFIQINLDEEITVSVPIRLTGEATAVQQNNGLVDPAVESIEVRTTPRTIPDEFVIDVTAMDMDTVIRLADVEMPEGVTPHGDPEMPVVTVLTMRAEPEPEEAEVAEGELVEGAEGEAAEAPAEDAEGDSGESASE